MVWTIEAKVLPIGPSGHLYFEIWKDDGTRFMQINGLATDKTTGEVKTVGADGDYIEGYVSSNSRINGPETATQFNHPHTGITLFTGSEADVRKAIVYVEAAVSYINAHKQDYSYQGNPDDVHQNSNSIWGNEVAA
ncbi:MAG: hypothetical protein AABY33_04105 [Pseudomonadota bacterium]